LTLQLKPGGTNISIINLEHHALDLEYNLLAKKRTWPFALEVE